MNKGTQGVIDMNGKVTIQIICELKECHHNKVIMDGKCINCEFAEVHEGWNKTVGGGSHD